MIKAIFHPKPELPVRVNQLVGYMKGSGDTTQLTSINHILDQNLHYITT